MFVHTIYVMLLFMVRWICFMKGWPLCWASFGADNRLLVDIDCLLSANCNSLILKVECAFTEWIISPDGFWLLLKHNFDRWHFYCVAHFITKFLKCLTDFDLGKLQFGDGKVDDVILPPWASTPYEFIHKHRLALVCPQYAAFEVFAC